MEIEITYDYLKKPRRNSVLTDDTGSEITYSHSESSASGAFFVRQPIGSTFENSFKSERNKTLLLFKTLPIYGKLLFSMICMIIVNFLYTSVSFYVRKNTSMIDIDIYSICGFFAIIPHVFVLSLGILIEGKICRWPSLMECCIICSYGLITYGLFPLTYFKILVSLNSNFVLLIELLIILSVSIGSYIFKIEKLPKFKNPGTILLFLGFLVSATLSSIFIFYQINSDSKNPVSFSNSRIIVILAFILFITQTCARNYQHVRFLKKPRSMFHEKPITFAGMNGILASPILAIIYLVTTILRWNSVKDHFFSTQYWIFVVYGSIIIGVAINILSIFAFTMTSTLFAHCFFPFRIIFDLVFQYVLFGKKANNSMFILSVLGLSSVILGIIGKYKILRQNIN